MSKSSKRPHDNGKQPAEGGEAEEGGAVALKIRKTAVAKGPHCPPYADNTAEDNERRKAIFDRWKGADMYFDIIGRCRCDGDTCNKIKMTINKFTPWTRFPIRNAEGNFDGHYLNEKFQAWWNPSAHRAPSDVKSQIEDFMGVGTVNGVAKWIPYYPDEEENQRKCKWPKFWFAVHVLYDWVRMQAVVDDMTLVRCIRAYYHAVHAVYKPGGVLHKYRDAGLLETESEKHRTLFREFRTDLSLGKTDKEALMNMLLVEKKRVVMLFDKVEFLKTREVKFGDGAESIRQWSKSEYDTATDRREPDNDAVAALLELSNAAPFFAEENDKEEGVQDTAATVLAGMGGSAQGGVGGSRQVCMLLDCLHRLAVDGDGM